MSRLVSESAVTSSSGDNDFWNCSIQYPTNVDDFDLESGVIYVRRSVWNGPELDPKTDHSVREIDIDPALVKLLREHIGESGRTRVFEARNGSPLSAGNIRNRVLHPLLARLGIPKDGLHAFRHSRVTVLRNLGTPVDLQRQSTSISV